MIYRKDLMRLITVFDHRFLSEGIHNDAHLQFPDDKIYWLDCRSQNYVSGFSSTVILHLYTYVNRKYNVIQNISDTQPIQIT